MIDSVETLNQRVEALKKESFAATKILISMGTCGIAAGAAPVLEEVKKLISERQLENSVEIVETGCIGQCHAEPSVEICKYRNKRKCDVRRSESSRRNYDN